MFLCQKENDNFVRLDFIQNGHSEILFCKE